MIETGVLAKLLQDGLNANTDGVAFKIFADDGQFQKALRNINTITKYVNGVYTVISSDLLPFKALNMYSITATLDLVVDVENAGKDENGNYIQVEKIKKILNNYGNANNGQIFTITGLGYQITAVYNFATVGTEQVLSPIGRCIPIQMWIRYQFVENGVNSNSVQIYINGENIPFNMASITRLRTMTNNNYSGDVATKATGEQNGISLDITMPLLSTKFGKSLTEDVLNGGNNKAYLVTIVYNTKTKVFLMTLGTNISNLEINKNVGQKISLVEIMPEIADTSSIDVVTAQIQTNGENFSIRTQNPLYKLCSVIWGDGTQEFVEKTTTDNDFVVTHQYASAGVYNVYYNFMIKWF